MAKLLKKNTICLKAYLEVDPLKRINWRPTCKKKVLVGGLDYLSFSFVFPFFFYFQVIEPTGSYQRSILHISRMSTVSYFMLFFPISCFSYFFASFIFLSSSPRTHRFLFHSFVFCWSSFFLSGFDSMMIESPTCVMVYIWHPTYLTCPMMDNWSLLSGCMVSIYL